MLKRPLNPAVWHKPKNRHSNIDNLRKPKREERGYDGAKIQH
jgi:predicted RNA polymerase sigma factor